MAIKVLVAEDEVNQLELLSFNLVQAGFDVVSAPDGEAALMLIEDEQPDLVILDWMMPKMSGIELCRTLRAQSATRDLPIIILSARGEEGDRTLGLDTGADDYIAKPFSPRELVSRVKALLRRARPALVSDVVEFDDLKLYPGQMLVTRDGHKVELGPKEYHLLTILIERPGQVYSRGQLIDLVWGHGVYVEERTVDTHLSRLRKSLNNPVGAAQDYPNIIRTVRGTGYALQVK
ncbi:MAG: response regulator [Alphaproteobacteria bacterium]|nr:response regulator [Alphaproteobacteria bacterium]